MLPLCSVDVWTQTRGATEQKLGKQCLRALWRAHDAGGYMQDKKFLSRLILSVHANAVACGLARVGFVLANRIGSGNKTQSGNSFLEKMRRA